MKNKLKERYFTFRQTVRHYIKCYSEDYKVYVYFYKNTDKIVFIDIIYYNVLKEEHNIYETTLKNLYLYLFIQDYFNVNQALLVYFANKELKGYKDQDILFLLNITSIQLERLENGILDFKGPLSFENVAIKLGFNKGEFTEIFKNNFRKVNNERQEIILHSNKN